MTKASSQGRRRTGLRDEGHTREPILGKEGRDPLPKTNHSTPLPELSRSLGGVLGRLAGVWEETNRESRVMNTKPGGYKLGWYNNTKPKGETWTEPNKIRSQFLVSVPRVPGCSEEVLVHAALGQAVLGRALQ